MDGGQIVPVPVSMTAELLYALLSKTGPIIAASDDPAQAVNEIEPVLFRMLNGLHRDSGTSRHKRLGFASQPKPT